ncbi:MAG: hypothetical protein PW734_04470 [Verrucomicrobium sp.]|nr:hypothetical protein [Verrucomicrobium sp.]
MRPNLAARVLAEAARVRADREAWQMPRTMLAAGLVCALAAGTLLAGVDRLAGERQAAWAQVAAWTQSYEVD